MPLRRVFNGSGVVTTIKDAWLDRLSKWSDIQEYMPFLCEQAASRDKPVILELGSRRGNSTFSFLAGVADNGGHVWSCDIDDVRKIVGGIGPWARSPNWTFIHGDDMDPAVQGQLPAEVDVFFHDTSHEYEHTMGELRAYMPRVKKGGIALFHDTNVRSWPGYEWDGEFPPVHQALDDYCAEAGLQWENRPGKYGLGVIHL